MKVVEACDGDSGVILAGKAGRSSLTSAVSISVENGETGKESVCKESLERASRDGALIPNGGMRSIPGPSTSFAGVLAPTVVSTPYPAAEESRPGKESVCKGYVFKHPELGTFRSIFPNKKFVQEVEGRKIRLLYPFIRSKHWAPSKAFKMKSPLDQEISVLTAIRNVQISTAFQDFVDKVVEQHSVYGIKMLREGPHLTFRNGCNCEIPRNVDLFMGLGALTPSNIYHGGLKISVFDEDSKLVFPSGEGKKTIRTCEILGYLADGDEDLEQYRSDNVRHSDDGNWNLEVRTKVLKVNGISLPVATLFSSKAIAINEELRIKNYYDFYTVDDVRKEMDMLNQEELAMSKKHGFSPDLFEDFGKFLASRFCACSCAAPSGPCPKGFFWSLDGNDLSKLQMKKSKRGRGKERKTNSRRDHVNDYDSDRSATPPPMDQQLD